MNTSTACFLCEAAIEEEDFSWYPEEGDGPVCESCYSADLENCETIFIVDGDEVSKYYIANFVQLDEYGDYPIMWRKKPLKVKAEWVSTSAWRGYMDITLPEWKCVLDGWTTGNYDDEVGRRKSVFNHWATDLLEHKVQYSVPIALVNAHTSNLFSMAISVMVRDEDVEKFKEELAEMHDVLYEALT